MADDDRRRRVRDISECSESESNTAENSDLNLTQCESEVGALSQSEAGALSQNDVTALSQSVTAPSETGDNDQDDISGEETTDAEEADSGEYTDDDESKTEDEDSKVEIRRVSSKKQSDESETDGDEDAESANLGSDEEAWKKERRHSGDGEEQKETVGEKTDIDNDRSNPAYIPRKGMFYEHDLRIGDGGGDGEKELDVAGNTKKKLWLESHKWNHDRYDERSQAPKTKGDLVAEYGYDIRLGSSPPKAKPQRFRGNRRPRGSRQLGDYINPAGHFDSESNEDSYSQLRSTSGNLNSEQSRYQSSDSRYRSTDDVSNYNGRGNRRSIRRGYAQRTVPVNRGRGYASRDKPSRNADEDTTNYAYSDEDSNRHENIQSENRRKIQDNHHEFPDGSGRTDNRSERGRSSNFKNLGNSRNSEDNVAIRRVQSRAVVDASNLRIQCNESESSNQRWVHREQKPNAQSGNVGHDEETWEDEEIAVYSENMYARSVAEREQKSASSVKINNDVRVPRQLHYRATRTISNTHYKNVDADARGRDRNNQIQNVVASMNKISLGKDSGGSNDNRKASSSHKDNDTSEIIPPVTRAFTRTSLSGVSSSMSSNIGEGDSLPSNRDAAIAFRPVNKIPTNSEVSLQQLQSQASKPKRYSTQRQRGQQDTGDSADVVNEPLSEQAAPQVTAGYSLPPRLQRNKYYDEEALRQHMLQFPSRSVLASNVQSTSNVAYSMAGVPLPPKYYQSQPPEATQQATESSSNLMHAARFLAPRHMIPTAHAPPGQYYQTQPMYNYVPMQATYIPPPSQSHYRMTAPSSQIRPYVAPAAPSPQMMSEVSPSMEVRGGTVYFNAETQQPELRVGGIYYGPTGPQSGGASISGHRPSSAIPIVNPQEAMTAGDGLQYYTNEYVPFEHYVASPVPYEASSVCLPDSSVEGAYA